MTLGLALTLLLAAAPSRADGAAAPAETVPALDLTRARALDAGRP